MGAEIITFKGEALSEQSHYSLVLSAFLKIKSKSVFRFSPRNSALLFMLLRVIEFADRTGQLNSSGAEAGRNGR